MGIALDIGLGALAFNLARSLKASVEATQVALKGVVKITEDHEVRIKRLETDNDVA